MQSGFENVISVPNGASIGKMDYFDSSFLELEKVKSFILATDNDLKGIELKNEFIRRLGFEKCKIANLRQYKDLNEVLITEGRESVQNTIKNAKILKADDVYELQDFYNDIDAYFESGLPQGKKLGIIELDEKIRWMTSHLAVVTGSPTSGKSEFVDFIISKLNVLHGWKCAYYSQENSSIPIHFARIFSKFVGKKYKKGVITIAEKETGENYINDNIFWVQPDFDINPDEILKKFEYLVKAKGVKIFVVDPFNRIEQGANYGNQMQFIQKTLGKLISFCRKTDSLLFLVAHPTKLRKNEKNGKFPIATAYDISGSADFWNMPSYVISVRREQDDETLEFLTYGQVVISKAKVNETMGDTGIWNFRYNVNNGRYITDDKEKICNFDNTNWITKEEYKEPEESKLQALNPYEAFGMPKNDLFCKDGTEQDDDMPF
jgi:twinkle protein